jgi:hypothetical protein
LADQLIIATQTPNLSKKGLLSAARKNSRLLPPLAPPHALLLKIKTHSVIAALSEN